MKNSTLGKKIWAFSGGFIPLKSTGKEPNFVSSDKLSVLNTTNQEAELKLTLYFTNCEPISEFKVKVKPQRVRKFRINDLIDPQAIPLGVAYGGVLESNVPVVVQFTRQDTGQKELAIMGTMAFPADQV